MYSYSPGNGPNSCTLLILDVQPGCNVTWSRHSNVARPAAPLCWWGISSNICPFLLLWIICVILNGDTNSPVTTICSLYIKLTGIKTTDFGYISSQKNEIYGNATVISLAPGFGYESTASSISVYGQNWTLLQGVYYSMISLTTVGFGDYYLGRPDDPKQVKSW